MISNFYRVGIALVAVGVSRITRRGEERVVQRRLIYIQKLGLDLKLGEVPKAQGNRLQPFCMEENDTAVQLHLSRNPTWVSCLKICAMVL